MVNQTVIAWIRTTAISCLGGGISGAVAAAMDPTKWRFPQDLGSGKLWPFFFMGFGLMFLGALMRSPVGQQVITIYKESQAEMVKNKEDMEKAKKELKGPSK